MAARRKTIRSLLALAGVLLAAVTAAACGTSGVASSPSPRPAVSVSAFPGYDPAAASQDSAAGREVATRVVMVYIRQGTTQAETEALAQRIAAMPEVAAYHYVSEKDALARARQMFARLPKGVVVGMFPASFDILVRERKDVVAVARRFFKDSAVDNDPGTHNGVRYVRDEFMQSVLSPSPTPSQ